MTWSYLLQLTQLRELGLSRCEGAALAAGFASITRLSALPQLDLSGCMLQVREGEALHPKAAAPCCSAALPASTCPAPHPHPFGTAASPFGIAKRLAPCPLTCHPWRLSQEQQLLALAELPQLQALDLSPPRQLATRCCTASPPTGRCASSTSAAAAGWARRGCWLWAAAAA
jgi:hypothetical protein